jgi:hypothetical protein
MSALSSEPPGFLVQAVIYLNTFVGLRREDGLNAVQCTDLSPPSYTRCRQQWEDSRYQAAVTETSE